MLKNLIVIVYIVAAVGTAMIISNSFPNLRSASLWIYFNSNPREGWLFIL